MDLRKVFFIGFLLMLAQKAFAVDVDDMTVVNVGSKGDGVVFISVDKMIPEPGCNRMRFDIPSGHSQSEKWTSFALAALASGAKTKVRTKGCLNGSPTMDESSQSWFYVKKP